MKKPRKNLLDEMQEQKMLRIEHNGFWIAFIGLCVVIVTQLFVLRDVAMVAGEVAMLAVLAGYMEVACIRNGIWDRKLKANAKTNFWVSLVGGMVAGLLVAMLTAYHFDEIQRVVRSSSASAGLTFVLCEIALTLSTFFYKRKKREQEELADQEEA